MLPHEHVIPESTPEYVTWQEAARILSVKKGVFYYYVAHDLIRQDKSRPVKAGRFLRSDVLNVRTMRTKKVRRGVKRHGQVVYDWIKPTDILAVLNLSARLYGPEIDLNEPSVYQNRQRKNGRIAMACFSLDRSVCLGYISLIPLPEQAILDIMAEKRTELDIRLEEVETYDRPGGFTLLCTSAAIDPDYPLILRELLRHIIEYWISEYPTRYILRIYAQAISPQGRMMVKHLFLSPMAGYPQEAYFLDLARDNPARLINQLVARMEAKAPLPVELTTLYTPPLPSGRLSAIVTQARAERTTTSTLPLGYVAFPEMAERHNVNANSLRSDLREKKITAERGQWLHNGKALSLAFSPEQHKAFARFYRHRSSFQRCPDCLDEHGTL